MPIKCPIKRAEYMQQYNSDPVNKARKVEYDKQWRLKNKELIAEYYKQYSVDPVYKARKKEYYKQYYSDPVNKARKVEYDKQYSVDPFKKHLNNIMYKYGLTEEMFIKLYEKQDGLCLGCEIVLVTRIIGNEEGVIGIKGVDYEVAHVDHDHSFDIDGKFSGDPDSVRGLLCPSCNIKDVLNPESDHYIYGDDPTVKETLIKNREANIILRQWHKEENS